jgi:hypothetical protein
MLENKEILEKISDKFMKISVISAVDKSKYTGTKDRIINAETKR